MKRFIGTIAVSAVIFLILLILRLSNGIGQMWVLSLIAAGLFLLGAFFLRLLSPRVRTGKFFSLRRMNFLEWRFAFCFTLILIFGSVVLNYLTDRFFRLFDLSPTSAGGGYPSVGVALLCVAVLPALFEELYFRGAVQSTLKIVHVKTFLVILIPAVLFAFMHGNLRYFLTNLFGGVLLSLLVWLTDSCFAAIVAHFLSNLVSYYFSAYGAGLSASGIGSLMIHISVVCLIGAACHALHLLKKLLLRHQAEDRSGINGNSRRWDALQKKERTEND